MWKEYRRSAPFEAQEGAIALEGIWIVVTQAFRHHGSFQLIANRGIGRSISDVRGSVFGQELEGIGLQVKHLCNLRVAGINIVLDELEAPVGDRTDAGTVSAAIHAVEVFAVSFAFAF